MNINTDYNLSEIKAQSMETEAKAEIKEASENGEAKVISEGDEIRGEVTDLRQNEITIRLEDNSSVSGKALNPENIKIGMRGTFSTVKKNPLLLELISQPKQNLKNNMISDILSQMNFKTNAENIAKVEALMDNSFAVTKENFLKLNQAFSLMGNIKQAVFFLNNDIKINTHNAEILKNIVNKNNTASGTAENIISTAFKTENTAEFAKAVNIISGSTRDFISDIIRELAAFSENTGKKADIMQNTVKENNSEENVVAGKTNAPENVVAEKTVIFKNTNEEADAAGKALKLYEPAEEEISEKNDIIIKFLRENVPEKSFENIKSLIEKSSFDLPKAAEKILKKNFFADIKDIKSEDIPEIPKGIAEKTSALAEINDNFREISEKINDDNEFISQFKDSIYLQIPLNINNTQTNAELYIFNGNRKSKMGKSGSLSALVALDTANLGHFEAYLTKKSNDIYCQFRLENEEIKNIVKNNISMLKDYLENKNFKLSKYDFLLIDEPFTPADKNPSEEKEAMGNFAFDMRM